MSEEQRAKIAKTLREKDRSPPNEPWVAEGISKTSWYRRLHRQNETPEQASERRAKKMAYYYRDIEASRRAMRERYHRKDDLHVE